MEAKQGRGLGDAMSCTESPLLQVSSFLFVGPLLDHKVNKHNAEVQRTNPGTKVMGGFSTYKIIEKLPL